MTTQHTRPHTLLALATVSATLLVSLGAVGCSSSSSRDRSANEDNTYAEQEGVQRSRAKALEYFRQASQLHEDQEYDKALIKYRESIEQDNTLFAAWNNMGQLLMQQKNYADAVAAYKIASDLQLNDPRPDYNIGLAYQTIGWGKESLIHFERSLERDSNYLPSIRGAVRSAEMLGVGDQQVLEYIQNGQLRETDDQWREYFDRQKFRVEKLIEENT